MIILGLGSNMGFPLKNLRTAIGLLDKLPDFKILKISSVYMSDAELPEQFPKNWERPYLNLALLCQTTLSPRELYLKLHAIEEKMGRKRHQRWEPRLIDIDILTLGTLHYQDDTLTIPHQSLFTRPFALLPLLEIFPEFHSIESQKMQTIPWLKPNAAIPFHTRRINACLSGPALMGIVNITPDSFSDGNHLQTTESQVNYIRDLILSGAEVIDIGAESTRPHATPLSAQEEWSRLEPLLTALNHLFEQLDIDSALRPEISLDTYHAHTVEKVLKASSIQWINDVSGKESSDIATLIKHTDIRYVSMHNLGVPPSSQKTLSTEKDPLLLLREWMAHRISILIQEGFDKEQLIMDPGIGFGLTASQSWEVLQRIDELNSLLAPWNIPLLVGHSRKSFLTPFLNTDTLIARDLASSLIAFYLAKKKISYLRVHAVSLLNSSMNIFQRLNPSFH